jgi:hypothetical protein
MRQPFGVGHIDARDLGDAGDSGHQSCQPEPAPRQDQLLLRWQAGARSDETHLAFEDIPKLRQFVEFQSAQVPSNRRDGGHRHLVRRQMGGLAPHGAQLVASEEAFVLADAPLPKDGGSLGGNADQQRAGGNHRCEQHEANGCRRDVEGSLHASLFPLPVSPRVSRPMRAERGACAANALQPRHMPALLRAQLIISEPGGGKSPPAETNSRASIPRGACPRWRADGSRMEPQLALPRLTVRRRPARPASSGSWRSRRP